MFVGFIAVIVIILIIVTLMSTGATSGSGGVDQTKATKAIGEISALSQSIGFYKTTSVNNNYAAVSVDNLVSAGIVNSSDVVASTVDMFGIADGTANTSDAEFATAQSAALAAGANLIASKAVPGLYYDIAESEESASQFVIRVIVDSTVISSTADAGLLSALETAYAKLTDTSVGLYTGSSDGVASNDADADGVAAIVLR